MEERTTVSEDDWRLASTMYEVSSRVRDAMVQYGRTQPAREQQERHKARATGEGLAETARLEAREADGAPLRVAKRIAELVHGSEQYRTEGAVNRKLAQRDKDVPGLVESAWELATAEGWVARDGTKVEPGESRPA